MIGAVFVNDVFDYFAPALIAEIHVKIGHTDTLGIEKSFKKKIIFHRVNSRYSDTVGGNTSCARASARSYGNTLGFCVSDKIMNYQEIIDITHFVDDVKLIIQPVKILLGRIVAVVAVHSGNALLLKPFKMISAVGNFKMRKLRVAELKVVIALFGNYTCIFNSLRYMGKKLPHLLLALEIELVALKLKTVALTYRSVCCNTDKHLLNFAVLTADIMGVVCCDKRYTRFLGKPYQQRLNLLLLTDTVVLQFKIKIPLTENPVIPQSLFLCTFVIVSHQSLRYLAGKTGGEGDQALMMLFKQFTVYPRLCVKALSP